MRNEPPLTKSLEKEISKLGVFKKDHYKNKINWNGISFLYVLSEEFIHHFRDQLNWNYICVHQVLSELFINQHLECIDWVAIQRCQVLSDEFLLNNYEHVNFIALEENEKINLVDTLRSQLVMLKKLSS